MPCHAPAQGHRPLNIEYLPVALAPDLAKKRPGFPKRVSIDDDAIPTIGLIEVSNVMSEALKGQVPITRRFFLDPALLIVW